RHIDRGPHLHALEHAVVADDLRDPADHEAGREARPESARDDLVADLDLGVGRTGAAALEPLDLARIGIGAPHADEQPARAARGGRRAGTARATRPDCTARPSGAM